MELRKVSLETDIANMRKEKDEMKLVIQRNEAVSQDITDENMAQYYENQVKSLTDRKLKIDKVALTDQDQAVEYQKKLHGFEKLYFDKLMELVKNS